MVQNRIIYTITKYLTFIAPVVILLIIGFFLFHSIILAVTFTLIVGVIGLIGLAYWVSKSGKYDKKIQQAYKKHKW